MTKSLLDEGSTTLVYRKPERKRKEGVIRHLGTEWILMRVEVIQGMIQEVNKTLGTGACVVWYLAGRGSGKSLATFIQKKTNMDNVQEICMKIAEICEKCGWGVMQPVMFGEKTDEFLIRIHNNVFVRGMRSKTSSCYYIKGFLEGILEQLTRKRAKSSETKCIAKGDPYCEFSFVLS